MSEPMEKAYEPALVEAAIYQYWMDQGVFEAEVNPNK